MSPEERFVRELEHLRRDSDEATQFLYTWLALHWYASRSGPAKTAINKAPLYWKTNLGALQAALFISLGRIFDKNPRSHSIERLLREASQSPQIFSRASLAKRKRRDSPDASWVRSYVKDAHVPTSNDFRRLFRYVKTKRKIYENAYEKIRHKVFAHGGAGTQQKKDELFAKTQLGELQRLVLSLRAFHNAMLHLYVNGIKPAMRVGKYSVTSMCPDIAKIPFNAPLEQRVFAETCRAIGFYVAGAQQ
jgi:HEPN domain-containing protein